MRLFPRTEMDGHQSRMYRLLTCVFFLVLGGYWLIRPMKMGVFVKLVGIEQEPRAKLGTVVILVPLLMCYNKLYMSVKHIKTLTTAICAVYTLIFGWVALVLVEPGSSSLAPELPGKNIGEDGADPQPRSSLVGWLVYWSIESYGTVVVAMLWSVMASVSTEATAASVYPTLVIFQQLGAVGGATLATFTDFFGFSVLFAGQAVSLVVISLMIRQALDIQEGRLSLGRALQPSERRPELPPTGLLEGVRLIGTKKYVFGVFIISTFAEIVSTIMDFQMKVMARDSYERPEEFAAFMGHFGQAANIVSLLLALFGTQQIVRKFGLQACLVLVPSCILSVVCVVFLFPNLWVLFFGMITIKALGYSLNVPAREMLYIRTSKDIKFKAKSWIDMFGTRGSKAVGSVVNNAFRKSMADLLSYGSLVSSSFSAVWLVTAVFLGRMHKRYELEGKFVE